MSNILDKIFCDKKIELDTVKCKLSLPDVKTRIANNNYKIRDIREVLESSKRSTIIAEIKPRTPFKGELLKNFDLKIEYLECRNTHNLSNNILNKPFKLFVAYYIDNVRLIDNF